MSCFLVIFHRNLEVIMFCRKMKNIVVIGAGYAGIGAAQTAAKLLSKDEVKITVLEKRPFFFNHG